MQEIGWFWGYFAHVRFLGAQRCVYFTWQNAAFRCTNTNISILRQISSSCIFGFSWSSHRRGNLGGLFVLKMIFNVRKNWIISRLIIFIRSVKKISCLFDIILWLVFVCHFHKISKEKLVPSCYLFDIILCLRFVMTSFFCRLWWLVTLKMMSTPMPEF